MTKYCNGCSTERPTDDFWRSARARDGLQNRCRFCMAEAYQAWCDKNAERNRLRWAEEDAEKVG